MATKFTTRKTATAKKATPVKTASKAKTAKSPAKKASTAKKPANTVIKKAAAKKAPAKKAPAKKTPSKTVTRLRTVQRGAVDKQFQPLAELLVTKQGELMQAYAIAKSDTRDRLDDGTEDYIDYAVNSYAKDFMLSLTELEREQLQLVRAAIHRLNRGEYGECLQCGIEIPMKRLEVAPWVRYCIQCQELEDQGLLPEIPFAGLDDEEAELEDVVDDDETELPEPDVEVDDSEE